MLFASAVWRVEAPWMARSSASWVVSNSSTDRSLASIRGRSARSPPWRPSRPPPWRPHSLDRHCAVGLEPCGAADRPLAGGVDQVALGARAGRVGLHGVPAPPDRLELGRHLGDHPLERGLGLRLDGSRGLERWLGLGGSLLGKRAHQLGPADVDGGKLIELPRLDELQLELGQLHQLRVGGGHSPPIWAHASRSSPSSSPTWSTLWASRSTRASISRRRQNT